MRRKLLTQPSNSRSPPEFRHLTQLHHLHLRTRQPLLISHRFHREMEKFMFRNVLMENPLVVGGSKEAGKPGREKSERERAW
jgi:hypothetical protein